MPAIVGDMVPEPAPTDETLDDVRSRLGRESTTRRCANGQTVYGWWRGMTFSELTVGGPKRLWREWTWTFAPTVD